MKRLTLKFQDDGDNILPPYRDVSLRIPLRLDPPGILVVKARLYVGEFTWEVDAHGPRVEIKLETTVEDAWTVNDA
jgi:hypothetical protein